jgi:hypothetical protein
MCNGAGAPCDAATGRCCAGTTCAQVAAATHACAMVTTP